VIQEGKITVKKCVHRGASARQERHTLSLGRNKHGHNNSAPLCHFSQKLNVCPQIGMNKSYGTIFCVKKKTRFGVYKIILPNFHLIPSVSFSPKKIQKLYAYIFHSQHTFFNHKFCCQSMHNIFYQKFSYIFFFVSDVSYMFLCKD